MLEVNFTPFPFLETERLSLRPMNEGDGKEMFFLRSDEGVMKYIDRPRAQNIDDAIAFVKMISDNIAANNTIAWALTLKGDDTLIGNISLWRLEKEHYRGELGYVLHPNHHGKGIMSEALQAVVGYAFGPMGLHSIEANVNPENAASINILERNGFVREGYFKENFYSNGKFLDSAVYSLVKPKS